MMKTGLSQPKVDQNGAKCMKNTCQNRLKTIANESWADFTPSKTLINTKFENLFFSGLGGTKGGFWLSWAAHDENRA